jgi:hypothetical protein
VTARFYRWGPKELGALTWGELQSWMVDAQRMINESKKAARK